MKAVPVLAAPDTIVLANPSPAAIKELPNANGDCVTRISSSKKNAVEFPSSLES